MPKRKARNLPVPSAGGTTAVSYGVLLYRVDGDDDTTTFRYLLGLIPQRNFWTVFKGAPNGDGETPHETARREFEEETGIGGRISVKPEETLFGRVGKKRLVIYLQEGSEFQREDFVPEDVVRIEGGYMDGRPEIVDIRWLTVKEALEGAYGAKVYNSQRSILGEAQGILTEKIGGAGSKDGDPSSRGK